MTIRAVRHPYSGSAPARALDVLQADGGWLTAEGVGLVVADVSRDTLDTALARLRSRGLVESRLVDLGSGSSLRARINGGVEQRLEWRAV